MDGRSVCGASAAFGHAEEGVTVDGHRVVSAGEPVDGTGEREQVEVLRRLGTVDDRQKRSQPRAAAVQAVLVEESGVVVVVDGIVAESGGPSNSYRTGIHRLAASAGRSSARSMRLSPRARLSKTSHSRPGSVDGDAVP